MKKIPEHYTATADILSVGEHLTVTKNVIKTRKNLSFSADEDIWWYPGMLSEDQIHPTVLGAKAFYAQVLADFPEMMHT